MDMHIRAFVVALLAIPACAYASLDFTRDGQQAFVPYQTQMDWTGELTLEVWLKPDEACRTHYFNYVISRNYGRMGYGLAIQGRDAKVTNFQVGTIPFGTWTHIAVVDGERATKLYINGKLIDVLPGDGRRLAGSLPLYIGNSNFRSRPGDTQFFGKIAEVRIWNVALDQHQIQARMHRFLRRGQPHLLAYFPLTEESGVLVHDVTGHLLSGHLGGSYQPDDYDPAWSSDEPRLRGRMPTSRPDMQRR